MQQTPAAPPVPPAPPVAPAVGQVQIVVPGQDMAGPQEIYDAFRAQRRELRNQLESLEQSRRELSEQLMNPMVEGANKAGLEQRIATIDQRIADVEKAMTASNAEVARAAAVPGAVVDEPPPAQSGLDEDVAGVLAFLVFFLVVLPIAVAYTRRLWKKAGTAVMTIPGELYERLTRLEQSVDTVALEVERIGEGQRFMTRVLSEHREAQPVPLNAAADPATARR